MIVVSYTLEDAAVAASEGAIPARPYLAALVARDPLGFGLLEPFQRDQLGDFAAGSGRRLIAASIANILGTEASAPNGASVGELEWRPEFGSLLHLLKHRPLEDVTTQQIARTYVVDAITRWEPRIRLGGVSIRAVALTDGGNLDALAVRMVYDLSTSAQNGVVLPPISQVVTLTKEA